MLKKKRQQKRFKATEESLLAHLTAFISTQDPEALHHFRLQVKKRKALLLYLQNTHREAYTSGRLKTLQSIFKHAGRIRSAQITLSLLEHYALADTVYRNDLETTEKKETDQFCARGKGYVKVIKELKETLCQEFQDIPDKSIETLFQKQLKKLTRFFSRPILGDEELHKVRRKIKNLLYLYKLLPRKLTRRIKWNNGYLDQLQHAIGEYHDIIQLLEFLKNRGYSNEKVLADIQEEKSRWYRMIRLLSGNFSKKACSI